MNKIKYIETELVRKLDEVLSKRAKILADPAVDLSTVKQNILVNIQYVGESLSTPSSSKINFGGVSSLSPQRIKSELSYKIRVFFKDLRGSYDKAYDVVEQIRESLNGAKLVELEDLSLSPIAVTSISFI